MWSWSIHSTERDTRRRGYGYRHGMGGVAWHGWAGLHRQVFDLGICDIEALNTFSYHELLLTARGQSVGLREKYLRCGSCIFQ